MPSWARCPFHIARIAALGGILLRHVPAAGAEPSPPSRATILLIDAGDDAAATRVAAELRASGLAVTTVQDDPATRTDFDIQLLSRSANAVAAIDIDPDVGEVRIWTVTRSTGQIVLRSLVRLDDDPEVVALRAVEALRASLNDPTWSAPPPIAPAPAVPMAARAGVPPALPESPRASAPATARPAFGASLGPALASGGGHFGGSWQVFGSLDWFWAPRWGVELMGMAPVTSAHRTESAGTATLVFALVAAGLRARALAARWCVLDFSAGIGTAALYTQGSPNPGFYGTGGTTWVATPYARMGYGVAVHPHVWLRADVTGLYATPRPTFATAQDLASWGEPLLLASVGVEVAFR